MTFGGGFELALACDLIIADKMARFCFPELRLGLIPGFGGIPRLKRDVGNAVVRDLLLTGRSFNATGAGVGIVSQVVAEGEALRAARATAAQLAKFDRARRSPPRDLSSRFRERNCGRRLRFSANCLCVRRWRGLAEVCGVAWIRIPICLRRMPTVKGAATDYYGENY